MSKATRAGQISKDEILKLLSDDENAKVSSAEGKAGLPDGQEYLDLEHLDQGIQRAKAVTKATMGHLLPRSAVSDATWRKIVAHLSK